MGGDWWRVTTDLRVSSLFPKALYGTTGGTSSVRVFCPVVHVVDVNDNYFFPEEIAQFSVIFLIQYVILDTL